MNKKENFLCLGKGIKVFMADNTFKTIETVVTGDCIISFNIQSTMTEKVIVERTAKSQHSVINRITLDNGVTIESTTDHPIWIKSKGWCSLDFKDTFEKYKVSVHPLLEGDECLLLRDNKVEFSKIISIDTLIGDFEMFDISGGSNHCFFANNILVHDENLTELLLKHLDTFALATD